MAQLAHEVGYSVREIEGALEQMEHMGYIRHELFGQACSSKCGTNSCSSHCEGCGFAAAETFTFWVLTERGQTIVSSKLK